MTSTDTTPTTTVVPDFGDDDSDRKICFICSKGNLDMAYPALIMANGARMEGIEANLFFTFFGLYGILKKYMNSIKIATVGNPAMRVPDAKGFALPTLLGANRCIRFASISRHACLFCVSTHER